jgi:uncharacterized protein (DUF1697 family)
MTTYSAFLRGIMPTNPNMRNEKLRKVFEAVGFSDVQTVITSGNVIFTCQSKNIAQMEQLLEKALTLQLGIKSAVFIRSQKDLNALLKKHPFKKLQHSPASYLLVTFLKKKPHELFNIVDLTKNKTPDIMRLIEKEHGKEVTSRTWKTVQRIVGKMDK